jgi:Flp pilus assembly protein TadG
LYRYTDEFRKFAMWRNGWGDEHNLRRLRSPYPRWKNAPVIHISGCYLSNDSAGAYTGPFDWASHVDARRGSKERFTMSNRRRGQSLVEFTLVGIPIIFVLISTFEISRGMWIYHTLAYSVKVGVRYASVHGINCVNGGGNPNDCLITIAQVAQRIQLNGVGLDPTKTSLTFSPGGATCTLTACAANNTQWPTPDGVVNAVGQPIRIDIRTQFTSALAMLWPGANPVSFAAGSLGASSQDHIQY